MKNQQWCIPAACAHASTPAYVCFSLHNSKSYETEDRTAILSAQLELGQDASLIAEMARCWYTNHVIYDFNLSRVHDLRP
jgi:hypothetical protein